MGRLESYMSFRVPAAVRLVPAAVVAVSIGVALIGSAPASAEPTPPSEPPIAEPNTTEPATTSPATTTVPTPVPMPYPRTPPPLPDSNDGGRAMACPSANSWSPFTDGRGVTATLFEYGPARITVTVTASDGDRTTTVDVAPGQFNVRIDFPGVDPKSVRSVLVRADGPGPLPPRCMLAPNSR
ncbi:hypothetical protein JGU71_22460 [Antrihabitans sp. YC3-6]|uniref:Uncharacterized protein n=1 Tax=Antrihabitans stalagmiti TaxID=2799499 RepID=A0A934NU73_9NOCA|nr:hypothetical protein [Antrihabitans stalagmiti]MBJ8341653.1 hypothetical protein [Antrihabitans stalagmiti]